MIDLGIVLLLVWLHFIADFVFQSDYMAQNKSKSNQVLLLHVLVYSLPFYIIGWEFALLNGAMHFVVDYITSRITSRLWAKKEVHWFFVVVGLDQAIHMTCLFVSYLCLVEPATPFRLISV